MAEEIDLSALNAQYPKDAEAIERSVSLIKEALPKEELGSLRYAGVPLAKNWTYEMPIEDRPEVTVHGVGALVISDRRLLYVDGSIQFGAKDQPAPRIEHAMFKLSKWSFPRLPNVTEGYDGILWFGKRVVHLDLLTRDEVEKLKAVLESA